MAKKSLKRDVVPVVEKGELSPLEQLQAIVDRVADERLDEVEADLIESELIEEGERHEKGGEIYRLFRMWRKQMTRIEVGEPDYFKFKEYFNSIFDDSEVDYWMHGEERYWHKIIWLILKQDGFCEKYKIRKRHALGLMDKCGWAYITRNFNPKDGWYLEIDKQSEKFRKENAEQFNKE